MPYRALGDELLTAGTLGDLAELEFAEGHPDRTEQLLDEALEIRADAKRVARIPIHTGTFLNSAAYRIAWRSLHDARAALPGGLRGVFDQQHQYWITILRSY